MSATNKKLGRDEFYKIAGVKQHSEFEKYLCVCGHFQTIF